MEVNHDLWYKKGPMKVTDMRILVIDDERLGWFDGVFRTSIPSPEVLTLIDNPEEGLKELSLFTYDLLFLDHDLQSDLDGSRILSEIFWNPHMYYSPRFIWTHSENGEGRKNIVAKCKSAGVPVKNLSFGSFYFSHEVFRFELSRFLDIHSR